MNRQGYWIIPVSLVFAFILTMLPLPEWARYIRPDWVSLVCIYWILAVPFRFGLISAWVTGLFLDVATGSLLCQHALGLTIISFLVLSQHQRLRLAPVSQQGLIILVLLAIKQTIVLWINGIIGQSAESLLLFYSPIIISTLIWPWVLITLRDLRRRVKLSE